MTQKRDLKTTDYLSFYVYRIKRKNLKYRLRNEGWLFHADSVECKMIAIYECFVHIEFESLSLVWKKNNKKTTSSARGTDPKQINWKGNA